MIEFVKKIGLANALNLTLFILLFCTCKTITNVEKYGGYNGFRGCYDLYAKRVKNRTVTEQELIEILSNYNGKHNTNYKYFYFSYNRFNKKGGHIIALDKNQIDEFKFIPTELNEPKFYAERIGDFKIDDIINRSISNASEHLISYLKLSSSQMRGEAYLRVQNLLKEIQINFSSKMSINSRINLEYHQIFYKTYTNEDISYDAKQFIKRFADQNNPLVYDMYLKVSKNLSFSDLCEIGSSPTFNAQCKSELINRIKNFNQTDFNNFYTNRELLSRYYPDMVSTVEIPEIKFISGLLPQGQYMGQLVSGKPNGIGAWKSDNKKMIYVGEWKNGKFDGRGSFRLSGQSNEIDNYGITGNFKNGKPNDNSMSVISKRIEKEDLDLKEKLIYTLAGATRVYTFPINTWSEVSKRIMGKLEEVEEENRVSYENEKKYKPSDEPIVESKEREVEAEKEINYENVEHPGVEEYGKWEDSPNSDDERQYIEFKDGKSGYIFKDDDGDGFHISDLGIRDYYYKTYEATIRALYVMKKYGRIIKRDRK